MYIRRIFGPDSPYSVQLASIEFRYMGIAVGTLERGDSPATRRARERERCQWVAQTVANQVPRSINPSAFSRTWSCSKMRSKVPSLVHVRYQWYALCQEP